MHRKLTITLSHDVYEGLRYTVGRGRISSYIAAASVLILRSWYALTSYRNPGWKSNIEPWPRTVNENGRQRSGWKASPVRRSSETRERLTNQIGRISIPDVLAVERAIKLQLSLS